MTYGEAPVPVLINFRPAWHEFMHYLYLPVRIPMRDSDPKDAYIGAQFAIPTRLNFLTSAILQAMRDAWAAASHLDDPYVYVTARRGMATPGNPLNRPGWHCDDFGGTDLNYTWCDAFPTRWLELQGSANVNNDDEESMAQFEHWARQAYIYRPQALREVDLFTMYRLSPHVIHAAPDIFAPGGMRSFFKISVSSHRYNLLGNSRNYDLDYDWPMVDRAELRNQPAARANRDYA